MPFKIDIYVDDKIYAVQVDEKEYELVLPIGEHTLVLENSALKSQAFLGLGKFDKDYFEKRKIKLVVNTDTSIVYSYDQWNGGLKIISQQ